jgi:asparagine synthase (glutamine-hydrolysing)
MCGITGMIGATDTQKLRVMTQMLYHRGPDDGAIWTSETAAFGHRRLSILDLSEAGRQPMLSDDGRYVLVYNGELFNYRELRRQLEARGHLFHSRTDSEVLLHGCMEWGAEVVSRLVGQFAFAFWDTRERTLLLARDHLGIKPLYIAETPDTLYFASEAKAIAAVLPETRNPRWDLLPQYLAFLWVPGEQTMFTGIRKLLPGSLATYRDGKLDIRRFWDPVEKWSSVTMMTGTDQQRDENFRETVREAVASQLMSDVPLGLLLSGGIDSSILLAEMSGGAVSPKAFTATYPASGRSRDVFDDDLPFARLAAAEFGADLEVAELEADVPTLLPDAIWHCDEPLADPTIVTNLALTRKARAQLTVLLSGMGADEILAGYLRYPAVLLGEKLHSIPSLLTKAMAGAMQIAVHSGLLPIQRGRRPLYLLRHLHKPFVPRFLGYSSYNGIDEIGALLAPELIASHSHERVFGFHEELFAGTTQLSPLSRMLAVDLQTFLPCLNLENMDKTSMANSVEMRVPFLDHRLVELSMALPDTDKLHSRHGRKAILRRAWKGVLPESILRRPKTGYSPPVRGWMRDTLHDYTRDILLAPQSTQRGIFQTKHVEALLAHNQKGREDHSLRIWQLLVFELWMRAYVDGPLRPPGADPSLLPDLALHSGGMK